MKQYGKLPRRAFRPPAPTRGGGYSFERKEEEPLTGLVQDKKAAQGEERLARTLEKGIRKGVVREHRFRWTTLKRGTPGYKELDELVFLTNGRVMAISVKGEDFVHRGATAKAQDKINEIIILAKLRELGYNVPEITTVAANALKTQDDADKIGRKLGVYR
jgi:hypothetical protein